MKRNELKPAKGSVQNRKRIGRGNASGWGGEAGRGHKGQKSRSGYSMKPGFEGGQMPLYMRLPKKRGFRNMFKKEYAVINLSILDNGFKVNDVISPELLMEKRLIRPNLKLKVLGNGELTKKMTIKAHKFSKVASDKIQSAGATLEVIL